MLDSIGIAGAALQNYALALDAEPSGGGIHTAHSRRTKLK